MGLGEDSWTSQAWRKVASGDLGRDSKATDGMTLQVVEKDPPTSPQARAAVTRAVPT